MHTPDLIRSPRPLTRLFALMLFVLAAALAGPFMSSASASTSASCDRSHYPATCEIVEPNVMTFKTAYPQVQLHAGEVVTVTAGGCVQTGGHGKTWKRYVDPVGGSGDLYSGFIHIPFATGGLIPLRNAVNATYPVLEDTQLYLGYNDDNYGDNGYWGRSGDNGTQNQCLNLPNAWVRISIW